MTAIPLRRRRSPDPPPRVLSHQLFRGISENSCMTLPRQVVPGRDCMITRCCSERRFFLRPDDDTNTAFIYCLALAAKQARVQAIPLRG